VRLLGGNGRTIEHGMGIIDAGKDQFGVNGIVTVQGHKHRRPRRDGLELVQMVGQRRLTGVGLQAVVVPAGPRSPVARQHTSDTTKESATAISPSMMEM